MAYRFGRLNDASRRFQRLPSAIIDPANAAKPLMISGERDGKQAFLGSRTENNGDLDQGK
jgi:hypothetical protein